jgi:ATP-dependent Clp protease ATP-binding subunit ClpC
VFERFTERARQGVVLAQEESRAFGHDYIGTEHILLGLLREEEGIAAGVLATLGVTVEGVRAQVESIVGHGDAVATGQIPFTPRAKKVLELSLREALALGHNHIGTEHVLLGLVRETDGVAVRILLELDAGPDRVRDEIVNALQGMPTPVRSAAPQQFSRRVPRRARETWLPLAAAGVWALFGLAVGVLLGWAIWG